MGYHPHPVVSYVDDIKCIATSIAGIEDLVMLVAAYFHFFGLTLAFDSGKTKIMYVGMPHPPQVDMHLGYF